MKEFGQLLGLGLLFFQLGISQSTNEASVCCDQNGPGKNISVHFHSFISQQENNLPPEVLFDRSEAD